MNAEVFKNEWLSRGEQLSPLPPENLKGLGLNGNSIDFLVNAGLPNFADPGLSFVKNTSEKYESIMRLNELYDYLEPEDSKYVVIGSCCDGDPIAINTGDNDQIEWLDDEDDFSPRFFNSSMETMAAFLILYRDFTEFNDYKSFTDESQNDLRNNMLLIDAKALTGDGFWKQILEIDISIRNDFL